MKSKRLTRWNERETLTILDRTLASSPFRVFSKLRLIDVIGPEPNERLSAEDRNFLMTAHLDFVVYDRSGYLAPCLRLSSMVPITIQNLRSLETFARTVSAPRRSCHS
jgi:hypothetical protein